MKRKIAFYTLGCKVNTFESESIFEAFKGEFDRVNFKEEADVYIINTCTVTNTADSKSRKIIRNALSRDHEKIVCVLGCFSQNKPDIVRKLGDVDIILGNDQKQRAYEFVMERLRDRERTPYLGVTDIFTVKSFESQTATTFENTRAFLKIQDGCNAYCSYCIIPYVRGNLRSRSRENTLSEVHKIVESGYKEIVLSGIHTGKYRDDMGSKSYLLKDLVAEILEVKNLERLRISSIEINEICDEIIALMKHNSHFARHLHIPLQSGSDDILRRMNRKYNTEDFMEIIHKIRFQVPDISITTDVIVGFPGETEQNFEETMQFCKSALFYEIHVFPYSKRDHTIAASLDDQIDEKTKKKRVALLTDLSKHLQEEREKSFIGSTVDFIIETINELHQAIGHTSHYLKVFVDSQNHFLKSNDFLEIKITGYENNHLIGKFIKFLGEKLD